MRILLIITRLLTYKKIIPHLGIAYIASSLLKGGHNVDILDLQIENYSFKEVVRMVKEGRYDAVGLTSTTDNRFNTIDLIKVIRSNFKGLLFVGGPHFSMTAADALAQVKEIDAVVRGEGEISAPELIAAYAKGEPFDNVKGISFRQDNGAIRENGSSKFYENIDLLPPPAWGRFNLNKYTHRSQEDPSLKFIGIMSSRGCPNNCSFCANTTSGIRFRTPKLFVDEIEHLYDAYGYRRFVFLDPTFTLSRRHCIDVCSQIIIRKLDIRWIAGSRVNTVDRRMLSMMKEAGCFYLTYGVESGSERVLKRIKKNINLPQVMDAVDVTLECGLGASMYFMVSLPDETLEDIGKTMDLIDRVSQDKRIEATYAFTAIYPGTELEEVAVSRNLLPKGFSWNKYRIFPKHFITDTVKTLPYFENRELSVGRIKLFILWKRYFSSGASGRLSFGRIKYMLKRMMRRVFLQSS